MFEDAERFHFDRFMHEDREDQPRGFSFGAGAKACLGADTTRRIIATIADGLIEAGVELEGAISEQGARGWVGWEDVPPSAIARGLKQLPLKDRGTRSWSSTDYGKRLVSRRITVGSVKPF
jgi:hypothetical protein